MLLKLEQALILADSGLYVFPVEPGGKKPVVPWRERSTRNKETIKNWWIDPVTGWQQDYNIGIDCGKSGILVIDVDTKEGKEGKASYARLHTIYGFDGAWIARTPSGGLHLYYRSSGFRNTTEHLAPGIDTRAEGGYVVAVGSVVPAGAYTAETAFPGRDNLVEPPEWLAAALASHRAVTPVDRHKVISQDKPDDIAWVIDFLKEREPAVEGHGGDHHTFVTACMLKERGVGRETALQLMLEYWNDECSPPWEPDDLAAKVDSAWKSAQNATGVKTAEAEFDIPASAIAASVAASPVRINQGWDPPDIATIRPRDWIFDNLALAQNVSLLIAAPGVGKSTLTLGIALSKATGINFLGLEPRGRGRVAIFNNEDSKTEMERRLLAQMQHYRIPRSALYEDDISGTHMIHLMSGEQRRLRIAKRLNDGSLKPADVQELIDYLKANDIRLCIIDPFSETHPAKENSNEEMLSVTAMYRYVAQQANCAIILVHHTRKLSEASSEGHSGNLDSARGASSVGGVARIVFTLNPISPQDARRYNIAERDARKYLLLEQAKANMSAPGESRRFFERYGELINATATDPDGESIGVLRPVTFHEQNSTSPATKVLIEDIESLVDGKAMSVSEIARELTSTFPFHADKKPRSLEKAISRLFSEGTLTGNRGTLEACDINGKRHIRFSGLSLDAVL